MTTTAATTITFSAGRYSTDEYTWETAANGPIATISLTLFRAIFDAVGEQTIDVAGDVDPGVLLGLVGLGPHGAQEAAARLRLVCRWACRRSLRVGFDIDQPAPPR